MPKKDGTLHKHEQMYAWFEQGQTHKASKDELAEMFDTSPRSAASLCNYIAHKFAVPCYALDHQYGIVWTLDELERLWGKSRGRVKALAKKSYDICTDHYLEMVRKELPATPERLKLEAEIAAERSMAVAFLAPALEARVAIAIEAAR